MHGIAVANDYWSTQFSKENTMIENTASAKVEDSLENYMESVENLNHSLRRTVEGYTDLGETCARVARALRSVAEASKQAT
jgi:hypothetical protein